jgi:hypothetical protein
MIRVQHRCFRDRYRRHRVLGVLRPTRQALVGADLTGAKLAGDDHPVPVLLGVVGAELAISGDEVFPALNGELRAGQ